MFPKSQSKGDKGGGGRGLLFSMMSGALLDAHVGAGETSGCPGLPLEAQDGTMGRWAKVWSGVLHLRPVWFLPREVEKKRGLTHSKPAILTGSTMEGKAAAYSALFCFPKSTIDLYFTLYIHQLF